MKKLLLSMMVLTAGAASAQWTEQATGFSEPSRGLSEIRPVDQNIVWCLAYNGMDVEDNIQEFTMTTDGGETWTPGFIDIGDTTMAICNIAPTSATTCFAAWVDPVNGGYGGINRTTDGGGIWEIVNEGAYMSPTSFTNVVHAFNANDIFSQGDPIGTGAGKFELYYSEDGGDTWVEVDPANNPNPAGTVGAAGAEYGYNGGNVGVGDTFWFVTNKGALYRTSDKGHSWVKLTSPNTQCGVSDFSGPAVGGQIFFSSPTNGILIKRNGSGATAVYTLYKTSDGGANWTNAGGYTHPYRSLAYIPGSDVLVGVGQTGTAPNIVYSSAYSTDNGSTWNLIQDNGEQMVSIAFADGTTGWASGFNEDPTTGGIYKYTGSNLGVSGVAAKPAFTASPNPTNGMLNITNENANITDVVVHDLLGKQVYSGKFSALTEVNLDLTSLTSGAYILTATADNGAKQTMKIVKN